MENHFIKCANVRFWETKGETITRCVHRLVCRLQHDNEHHRAFMATNELSSFLASTNNNARYDRSTNVLELEVNVWRTIGIYCKIPGFQVRVSQTLAADETKLAPPVRTRRGTNEGFLSDV